MRNSPFIAHYSNQIIMYLWRTINGIWLELFGSVSNMGRRMFVGPDPKSLCGTARSISKAQMSVKSSALVLKIFREKKVFRTLRCWWINNDQKTHSTIENRKPRQARGPPMNVNRLAQPPGTEDSIRYTLTMLRSRGKEKYVGKPTTNEF